MARNDPQVNLRIPQELKTALEAAAVANNRSLTAEVVARLERSFATQNMGFKADGLDIAGYLAMSLMIALDDGAPPEMKQQILVKAREIARPLMEGMVFSKTGPSITDPAKDQQG